MAPLIFYRTTEGVIQIAPDAHRTMLSFRQGGPEATEAGGILMGRHLVDGVNIVVDEVTQPQPSDQRSRLSFFRSIAHHYIARQSWTTTSQTSAYLGLWHTHPEPDPTPSDIDIRDWKKALRKDTYPGNNLYFVIVGQSFIRLWEGNGEGTISQCRLKALQ